VWDKYRPKVGPDLFDFFIKKVNQHAGNK